MKKLTLILITSLLLPLTSYAQEAVYVSGLLGLGQISTDSNDSFGTDLIYGARGGILFNDNLALGVFITRQSSSTVTNRVDVESEVTPLMAEVTYHLNEAEENGFVFSGMLGTAMISTTTGSTTNDETFTGLGASAGYSFAVSPNFSLSPQLTYIRFLGDGIGNGEGTNLSAMANLTIWF